MADSQYDFLIQAQDPVTVTFSDGTTQTGDFIRWFPNSDGASFSLAIPQGAADIGAVTSVIYVDEFRFITKLTPTTP